MEGVIDTSVLVDYILLEAPNHELAKTSLERIDRGFLPTVVVEELVSVLAKVGLDKKTINEKLRETLETYDVLSVNTSGISEAASHVMAERDIGFKRFNDKLILTLAKTEGLPLLTLDKELMKECKANGVKLLSE